MHYRKDGSVGVGRDGCTQSTETKARTGLRNGQPLLLENIEENKKAKEEAGTSLTSAGRESIARQKEALAAVATYTVRTLAVKGNNGYGHDERVLAKGQQLGCDFIGLQETRTSGGTTFLAEGYRIFCSGREETAARQGLYTEWVLLQIETPLTIGRALRCFHISHRNVLLILSPSCLAV